MSAKLTRFLQGIRGKVALGNVKPERKSLLTELARQVPVVELLRQAGEHTQPATVRDTTMLLARNNLDNTANTVQQGGYAPNSDLSNNQMGQNPNYTNPTVQEYNQRRGQQTKLQNEGKGEPQRVQKDFAMNTVQGNGANWFGTRSASAPSAPRCR